MIKGADAEKLNRVGLINKYLKFMKPEETIFDGISDSEMESIAGGTAEVQV
ncbi:MAG: hypothetical protein ACLRKX_22320 [Phocaeicola vulgatus]